MNNYDFLNLSPSEFENLVRDLLQAHFRVFIESFTTGRDKGIDLRFTSFSDNTTIVQCKRYQSFSSLYTKLQKEFASVQELNPARYIVATSVGLTPVQKDKILNLFNPYILSTEDILGRDELNNILGANENIERKHYKLWLSSTVILDKILNSKVYNSSHFEEEEIKDVVRVYVQNDSYQEAITILKKYHYLIISGIPGIGKTTLARIIVYYLLSEEFDEFIFLSDSISDAIDVYQDGKKQIFFFDDFLGKNFLEIKPSINEESKLLKFIEKVAKSKDKALILTTREYILNQAKNTYEIFNSKQLEVAKCILDLSKYTKMVRAQILYNHLFFADLPKEAIRAILNNETYLEIINHKNYSPRIIETVVKNKSWETGSADEFPALFKNFFDNPESVWKHAYENQITILSKSSLAVLFTLGTPVLLEDFQMAVSSFAQNFAVKYNLSYSVFDFKRTLKELENTFIKLTKDQNDNLIVEYQNPSIQDFLVNYLYDKVDLLHDIIQSALFMNQIFTLFKPSAHNPKFLNYVGIVHILKDPKLKQIAISRLTNEYNQLGSTKIYKTTFNDNSVTWIKRSETELTKLRMIYDEFLSDGVNDTQMLMFISSKFEKIAETKFIDRTDKENYTYLIERLKGVIKCNADSIIENFFKNLTWYSDFKIFKRFKKLLPDAFDKFIQDDSRVQIKLEEVFKTEKSIADFNNVDYTISELQYLKDEFAIDIETHMEQFVRIKNDKKEEDSSVDWESVLPDHLEINEDDKEIKNLFESLDD